jgi:hypothetical protein
MKAITKKEVKKLKETNHVVVYYPRKKTYCVDGFKYYKAR